MNLGFALTGAGAETLVPLGIAIFGGNKFFCNHLCGRVQFFSKLDGYASNIDCLASLQSSGVSSPATRSH